MSRRTRRHGSFIRSFGPVALAVASVGCDAAQKHQNEPHTAELPIVSATVQVDDEASLVVLARNPLAGIDNTTVINAEVKRGRLVDRKALLRCTSVEVREQTSEFATTNARAACESP